MKRLSSPERGRNAEGSGDRPKAIRRRRDTALQQRPGLRRAPWECRRSVSDINVPISEAPAPPGRYRDAATGGTCRSVPTAPLRTERYEHGDVVRYSKGSKALGIDAGEYARVERVDPKENSITVRTDDSQRITYDPRRLQGVTLYHEAERMFARGDRVQLTAPDRTRDVANRELGTIERIDADGRMGVRLDSGRTVSFEPGERRHLDYGYAVTSHSSQGQTADRVLVHVETERAGEQLVNRRLAYVAISRVETMRSSIRTTKGNSPTS